MKPKHQRLTLGILAIVAVMGASGLALSALQEQASFFYAPGDLVGKPVPTDSHVRLGGMVQKNSIQRDADGVTVRFVVGDGVSTVPVAFRGVTPDLFKEESGVVAEGRFNPDGSFAADNLLAKHDERYMPPQLAGNQHSTKSLDQ